MLLVPPPDKQSPRRSARGSTPSCPAAPVPLPLTRPPAPDPRPACATAYPRFRETPHTPNQLAGPATAPAFAGCSCPLSHPAATPQSRQTPQKPAHPGGPPAQESLQLQTALPIPSANLLGCAPRGRSGTPPEPLQSPW